MTEISRTQERPVILGEYIIEHKATVRQTAREFGISKSTVHRGVTNWNGLGRISSGGRWGRAVGLLGNILLCGVKLFFILYNEKSDSGEPLFCLEYVFKLLETINLVVTYGFVVFTQYPTFCF